MSTPFLILSTSIMLTSSLMAMSSTNWLFLWAALELNLLSFIPILMNSKKTQETEATVKYFLVQVLGSSILLMSSMSLWFYMNLPNQFMLFLMFMALILKMGMAPCHMWFPSVMTSISWMAALILSTWQKLAPLIVMSFVFTQSISLMMFMLASLNAVVGGMMGMNQSHLRTIMAYSSITHMGWMMSLIAMNKPTVTMTYFFFYSLIICPIFIILHMKNSTNSNSANKISSFSKPYQFIIPLLLLSLSGLPPLTGFIPKWMTISILANTAPTTTMILIIGAMMNTYFYLSIAFNFLLSINTSYYTKSFMMNPSLAWMVVLASTTLFSIPMFMMI